MFFSLVQADGYNPPLSIKGTSFHIEKNNSLGGLNKSLAVGGLSNDVIAKVMKMTEQAFTPGSLQKSLSNILGSDEEMVDKILRIIIKESNQQFDVDFGEGFWSDHFTYNLDILKTYDYMYPDQMENILYDDYSFMTYNAPYYVLPRAEKYNKIDCNKVRQYDAITKKKKKVNEWITDERGTVVKTNLLSKLLVLAATKFMNLDPPYCMGVEMEGGDKPGWNDALNGLPGLIGSGMSETVELKRIIDYVLQKLSQFDNRKTVAVLGDIKLLLDGLENILASVDPMIIHESEALSYRLWDSMNKLKEAYRDKIKYHMDSDHTRYKVKDLERLLLIMSSILDKGISKAKMYSDGILPSYFINEVTTYEELGTLTSYGEPAVKALSFKNSPLPLFLEAPTRYMKTLTSENALALHEQVKETAIYDKKTSDV